MELNLGFSTCPNDTFIFDAMIHHKIDTEGMSFKVMMADVEQLNRAAMEGITDITKLSYHAFAYVSDNYKLLSSGSALGSKNGPILIAKNIKKISDSEIRIAIPGKLTTANLLFSLFYPEIKNKPEYLFSEIEGAILSEKVDAGVIIHENRFTFEKKGLVKIEDLGERWESETGLPIPLGGIAIQRKHGTEIQAMVNRILKRSIEYAFANPDSSWNFVKENAREMDNEVIEKHIKLYVNSFSIDLGDEGKSAIMQLYRIARQKKLFEIKEMDIFAG
jgi:1,4-dihydroxy-6-naphthoate synthase